MGTLWGQHLPSGTKPTASGTSLTYWLHKPLVREVTREAPSSQTLELQYFFITAKYLLRFKHPPYPLMTITHLTGRPPPILRHPLGKWVRVGAVPSLLPLPQQVHLLHTYCSSPHSLCCFSPRCQGTALLVHQKPHPAKQKDMGPMLPAQKLVSIRKALTTLSGTECDLPGWADHRPEGICSSESNVNGSGLKTQLTSSINYKRVASRSILQKA